MRLPAHLTVAADADAVTVAGDWARVLGEELGLTERDAYRLDLCVAELVANIASYGYGSEQGSIDLRVDSPSASEIRLEIVDSGKPFDSFAARNGDPARDSELVIGGVGLRLVRAFADECRYERVGSSNRLVLTFKRSEDAGRVDAKS
jgi:anti-sigma regulatory factor (Ser/Thr protein kinase)